MIFGAPMLKTVGKGMLPFADMTSDDLPLGQLMRLLLFKVSVGLAAVMGARYVEVRLLLENNELSNKENIAWEPFIRN